MIEQTEERARRALMTSTALIVTAYVGNHPVDNDTLLMLIEQVGSTMLQIERGELSDAAQRPLPFVDPERSVFPNFIVCLEDGTKLRTLKGYLKRRFGMTTAEYRKRWDLPDTYPMVAPNVAAKLTKPARTA